MRRAKLFLFGYLATIGAIVLLAAVGIAVAPPVERDPDTYYEAYWNTIQTFDTVRAYDTVSNKMIEQVVESLYEYDPESESYEIIPALAAAMPEVSEDGLVYTIRLRPNVRYPAEWADGTPVEPWNGTPRHVTAHDFVFAFKRIADFHNATDHFGGIMQDKIVGANEYFAATEDRDPATWYYDDLELEGVTALDDLTLRIRLVKPFPQLIYKLTSAAIAPTPKEYYHHHAVTIPTREANEGRPKEAWETVHNRRVMRWRMLGTGPYRLLDYQRERHVVFEESPWYRGRPDVDGHPSGEGGVHPSLSPAETLPRGAKRQKWLFSRADLPRWFNFTLGAYDKIERIPKDKFGAAIEGGEVSPELRAKGMKQAKVPWPTIEYIAFHLKDPRLHENVHLRRAMSLAIDREYYIEQFRNGDPMVPRGLVPPGSFTWDPDYTAPYYRYDPEEAKREAELAKQYHREKFGEELPVFRFSLRSTSTSTRQASEYLKLAWESIGIRVRPEYTDFGKWLDDLRARTFEIYSAGWVGDYPDEETFLQLFFSENYEGGSNSTGYSNPAYDALYRKARVMPPSPERNELYREMARMIERDVPVILLFYDVRREMYYDWLGEVKPHVYLKAQPAYYELDGALREARLTGEVHGTLAELKARGEWPPPNRTPEAASDAARAREDAEAANPAGADAP